MGQEIEKLVAEQEMQAIRSRLEQADDGEYHIPGIKFADRTPEVAKLHDLMSRLSYFFPGYVWITADSLFPQVTGVTVRWRKKEKVIARGEHNPQGTLGQ